MRERRLRDPMGRETGKREERFLLKSACNEFGAMLAVECSWQRVGGDWERGGRRGTGGEWKGEKGKEGNGWMYGRGE